MGDRRQIGAWLEDQVEVETLWIVEHEVFPDELYLGANLQNVTFYGGVELHMGKRAVTHRAKRHQDARHQQPTSQRHAHLGESTRSRRFREPPSRGRRTLCVTSPAHLATRRRQRLRYYDLGVWTP